MEDIIKYLLLIFGAFLLLYSYYYIPNFIEKFNITELETFKNEEDIIYNRIPLFKLLSNK